MFAEDLDALFDDFGVVAQFGGYTANVVLDRPDQMIFGEMQLTTEYAITLKATDLPGIKHGDTVVVDGTSYTVRHVALLDDGALKHVLIKR